MDYQGRRCVDYLMFEMTDVSSLEGQSTLLVEADIILFLLRVHELRDFHYPRLD